MLIVDTSEYESFVACSSFLVWPLIDQEAKRGELRCGTEYSDISIVLIRDYTVVSSRRIVRLFTAVFPWGMTGSYLFW